MRAGFCLPHIAQGLLRFIENISRREMDHGGKAVVGFIGSHGDALKLREFAEEVLDQMAPFVEFGIEWDGCGTPRMLRDDNRLPRMYLRGSCV